MIWHKFGEVTVPVGESEIISVQKNTWQGPGAPYDVCLCLVVGKNGREKGKMGIKAQITGNQFSLSGT